MLYVGHQYFICCDGKPFFVSMLFDLPETCCTLKVLFGPNDDHELIHSETPVEVLPQDQVDKSAPTTSPKVSGE